MTIAVTRRESGHQRTVCQTAALASALFIGTSRMCSDRPISRLEAAIVEKLLSFRDDVRLTSPLDTSTVRTIDEFGSIQFVSPLYISPSLTGVVSDGYILPDSGDYFTSDKFELILFGKDGRLTELQMYQQGDGTTKWPLSVERIEHV